MSPHSHAEWNAVLGHELRSPIAAILGYCELVEEGTFGEIPAGALDSMQRIRFAARHLLTLVEAMEAIGGNGLNDDEIVDVSLVELCRDAMEAVAFDAESRGTRLVLEDEQAPGVVRTLRVPACRALSLALSAAIKTSPGARLLIRPGAGAIQVAGSRLDASRDGGATDVPLSGAALRLALARAAARLASLDIHLDEHGTIHLRFTD